MSEGLKNKYQAAFEHSLSAYLILREDGFITDANAASGRLFGFGKEEFVGMNCNQILKTIDKESPLNFDDGVQFDAIASRKRGDEIICVCVSTRIENREGDNQILLQLRGITAKDEHVRFSLLESVVVNTRDAVLITRAGETSDPDSQKIIFVNKAYTDMTGYLPEEVIGKNLRVIQRNIADEEDWKRLEEAIKKADSLEAEFLKNKKTGAEFWVNFSQIPVFDDQKRSTHFIIIERDITESKNRELLKTLQSDISRMFNELDSLTKSLKYLLNRITEFGNFNLAEVWLVNEDKTFIELCEYKETDEASSTFFGESGRVQLLRKGAGLPGITWQSGKMQFWRNLGKHEKFVRNKAAENSGLKTAYCVPIRYNNNILGCLLLALKNDQEKEHFYAPLLENLCKDLGAEIHRKQLEEQLNRIFNFSPDIICVAGLDGYFKKVNPAMSRLLGYTQDELLNHPISSFTHPDDRIRTEIEMDALSQNKGAPQFENRLISKDGKPIWLSWTTKTFIEEGKLYSVARDITEQKELELLLEHASKLSKIGSWELDLIEDKVYWSDVIYNIFEVNPDFVPTVENNLAFYKEGENRQKMWEVSQQSIQNGTPWDIEVMIVTQSGNEKWVRSIGESEFIDGKCTRLYGSLQDIHEKKSAELRLKNISNNIPGVLFQYQLNPDGSDNLLYLSNGANKLWGVSPEDTMMDSDKIWSRFHEIDLDQVKKAIQQSAENLTRWQSSWRYRHPDGTMRWQEGYGTPKLKADGSVVWDSIVFDISEKKELEEQLSRIFSSAPDIICVIGLDGYFKKVNPAMSKLLGYSEEELLNTPLLAFVHPEDKRRTEKEFEDVEEEIENHYFENRYITKSGKVIWLSWTSKLFFEDEIAYSVAKDITKEKELKELLDQANRLAKIGSWEVDLVEGTTYWSDITKEIHEVDPDFEPDIETAINYYKEGENRKRIRQVANNAIENGVPYDIEVQIITAKGHERWVRAIGQPEMVDGKCVRFYGSIQDIHEKKELQNLLDQTTKLAKIGSWELDFRKSDNDMYWSEMTRKILEVDEDYNPTLSGGFEFYSPGDRERIEEAVEKAIETGESFDLELMIITAKGNERWIRCIGQSEMENGKSIRLFGSYQDINQRKSAEIAYKRASEQHSAILDSIGDCFFAVNEDWIVTYWNRKAEELLSMPREKIIGQNLWDVYKPDKERKFYTQGQRAMNQKSSINFEEYDPDLEKWLSVNVYPSHNGLSIFFKDITDRKVSEARIIEKTRQLDAIAMFNGLLLKHNSWQRALDESLETFGKVVEADRVYYFQNKTDADSGEKTARIKFFWDNEQTDCTIDHPAHEAVPFGLLDEFLNKLSNNEPYSKVVDDISDEEYRRRLQEQNIKSVLALPVFVEGRFFGSIGFDDCRQKRVWDEEEISFLKTITLNLASAIENEEAEIALQKAYEERDEILESIGEAFFAVDRSWEVTYWNSVAEDVLDIPREKVVGKDLWDIYTDATELKFYSQYHKAMKEECTVNFEEFYPRVERWFEVSAYPSQNGLSVFFKDITNRKKNEERLKKLNRTLENQTQKLEISNAELEQFAFVASHDLQEPLRMVTSFLSILEKKYSDDLDEKAKEYIYYATDGAKRMRQIILDLLEFSRVGRVETEKSDVDINVVLDDVVILNRKLIEEKDARVSWETMPVIYAAKSAVQQLFQNLVNNALNYQEAGNKPEIKIWYEEDETYWTFYVEDNGIGINPLYREKIFNIFQRLHSKEEYSGTGVGLAICKKIVEDHGGSIGIDSKEGEGSTFYFTIAKRQTDT